MHLQWMNSHHGASSWSRTGSDWVLLTVFHHLLVDGTSVDRMLVEVAALYARRVLKPPTLQFGDYARFEAAQIDANTFGDALGYWSPHSDRHAARARLPKLRTPAAREQPIEGARLSATISANAADALRRLATTSKHYASRCFAGRLRDADDALLSARRDPHRHAPSMAAATRPTRSECHRSVHQHGRDPLNTHGRPSRSALFLNQVRARMRDALANADAPFERVVAALDLPRDRSRTPVFQTTFCPARTAANRLRARPHQRRRSSGRPRHLGNRPVVLGHRDRRRARDRSGVRERTVRRKRRAICS